MSGQLHAPVALFPGKEAMTVLVVAKRKFLAENQTPVVQTVASQV
jgi:hypothetical protein